MTGSVRRARTSIGLSLAVSALAILTAATVVAQPIHVQNTQPQMPPRTVALEEIWRVGDDFNLATG